MSDSGAQPENTAAASGGPSASPPASLSRLWWVQPITGVAMAAVVVWRLIPALERRLDLASAPPCGAGWDRWIPSAIVAVILFGVVAPTGLRDLSALVSAAKGFMPGSDKR